MLKLKTLTLEALARVKASEWELVLQWGLELALGLVHLVAEWVLEFEWEWVLELE